MKRTLWIAFGVYNVGLELDSFLKNLGKASVKIEKSGINVQWLAIDDGSNDEVTLNILKKYSRDLIIVKHNKNLGVVQGLLSAMKFIIKNSNESDFMAWLDSDGEHDPHKLICALNKVRGGFDIALTQIRYRLSHLSYIDHCFNKFMGAIQGEVILGGDKKFLHNCPGCWAVKVSLIKKIFPIFIKYTSFFQDKTGIPMRWGEDMTVLKIIDYLGGKIDVDNVFWSKVSAPNRSTDKIIRQSLNNLNHLNLYGEFFV